MLSSRTEWEKLMNLPRSQLLYYNGLFTATPPKRRSINQLTGSGDQKVSKYKVGDIVRLVERNGGVVDLGDTGPIEEASDGIYGVKFQSYTGDNLYEVTDKHIELVDVIERIPVDFDTVVIAEHKRVQILEALEQVAQTKLIFDTWGFKKTIEKGRGVSMLFYGEPGCGKTLMAQAIANKLKYTLKVISTADVESSKPGEAERNIRKHFESAKKGKTILLFDECDSLIYSRAGVGPILSAQINELLSQIERYDGITIFTTNRLGTLDEAVNRRLALKLHFEMPSQIERAEIWQRMFPEEAPVGEDVDWMRLAVVAMSGGYIKNAVLRAARMAAVEKVPAKKKKIRMEHLVKATRLEAESMQEFKQARETHTEGRGVLDFNRGRTTEIRKERKEAASG